MKLLELKKISKAYISYIGVFKILNEVNLSIQNKEVFAHQKFLKGVHVLSGPTGSGKTSTIIKLINNAVKNNLSPEKITVLSYKDNRLGAWSQIQMSCSKFGVELFKVSDLDFLETIKEELVSKDLVLIDTSSNLSNESLAEINKPKLKLHAVCESKQLSDSLENF